MIDEARGQEKPEGETTPKADSPTVTPKSVRSKMSMPKDMGAAYDAVISAAKRIMYSEEMKPQMVELLRGPGELGDKIGQGVVALMAILYTQTNGTMPPQLIIPAATELVAEAGDFLKKVGVKVTDNDIAEGMAAVVEQILGTAGIQPEQIPELIAQQGQQPQPQPQQAAPGGAPELSPDGRPMGGFEP
jgi:hypothetical protein